MKLKFLSKSLVTASIMAIMLGVLGGHWDAWFHVKHGHILLSPSHLVVIAGLLLFALCGIIALVILREYRHSLSCSAKRGLSLAVFGGILVPVTLASDELWHRFIGIEMRSWSPPHAAMFFGVACILFGVIIYSAKEHASFTRFSPLLLALFATLFMLVLFSMQDFDQPKMKWVAGGFTYPFALSTVITFLMITIMYIAGHRGNEPAGYVSISSFIGWALHSGIGQLVGFIGGFYHTLPAFPIFIPAIALDLWILTMIQKKIHLDLIGLLAATFIAFSVCYWAVVGWAILYGKLPQQISGVPADWALWYITFIPVSAAISATAVMLSNWALDL